jgi:predicted ATPase/signal transduction histidine kinase
MPRQTTVAAVPIQADVTLLIQTRRQFLRLVQSFCRALAIAQKGRVAYLWLCPANIIAMPDGGVEFVRRMRQPVAYVSPEQTGRMNRIVDYRSDFYSLGVVLYEALTGRLPFESGDALEVMHGHIARQAKAPIDLAPGMPAPFNDIVLKLLSKNAEDRYQSLDGLLADLDRCERDLTGHGTLAAFPLGEQDFSDRLQIPQKLFGREDEVRELLDAFERTAQGKPELLLVAGYSGIGKSSLVHEIHNPVTARRGYFISGKFDQFNRNIPYSATNQAFRELIRLLLTESEARIANWKIRLLHALGPNGRIMIDALPELEYIIGPQPEVEPLGPADSQYRLNSVVQNFVAIFATPQHPLVLFLDDLQWADPASLKLVELCVANLDAACLLVVGAYRDNEVRASDPLMRLVDELRGQAPVTRIVVRPLKLAGIAELISDTFKTTREHVAALARVINSKTRGNPFFVGQFLKSLHRDQLLRFENRSWVWDVASIEAQKITDNVIDLLSAEMTYLPRATQHMLSQAACLGNSFSLTTLAIVAETDEQSARMALQAAIKADLIAVLGTHHGLHQAGRYGFQHSRVQQAAYSSIPKSRRQAEHLRIGRLLLARTPPELRADRVFDIVRHLNEGRNLISSCEEKQQLAELNLIAAQRADKGRAYETGMRFATSAMRLLSDDPWESCRDLTWQIYVELVRMRCGLAQHKSAEQLIGKLRKHSRSPEEVAQASSLFFSVYFAQNRFAESIRLALNELRKFGVTLPAANEITEADIRKWRSKARRSLSGKSIDDLKNLPAMTDPGKLAAAEMLASLNACAIQVAPALVPLIIFSLVWLTVRFGLSRSASLAFAGYGQVLCASGQDVDGGYAYGELALELTPANSPSTRVQSAFFVMLYVRPYRQLLRHATAPLLEASLLAADSGENFWSLASLAGHAMNMALSGLKVPEATALLETAFLACEKAGLHNIAATLTGLLKMWTALSGIPAERQLIPEGFDAEEYARHLKETKGLRSYYFFCVSTAAERFLFGEYRQALRFFEAAEPSAVLVEGSHFRKESVYFSCLTRLALIRKQDLPADHVLDAMVRQLHRWAVQCPLNYLHKLQLVEAERCRVQGRHDKAAEFYDLAIAGADEKEYFSDQALANEMAGRFYLGLRKQTIARAYLEDSHAAYTRWGALAKARQLEEIYPAMLARVVAERAESADENKLSDQRIDLETVIKASQTVSGEIQLENLLKRLMQLLIENAGAERGMLLLRADGKLLIQAMAQADTIQVLQSISVEGSAELSLALVNYVMHTHESVVLADAGSDQRFNNDPYIVQSGAKSLFCLPLMKQAELVGMLYLENRLATGVFTAERAQLLQILSTQIAISLENASLYHQLERKVEARTLSLRRTNSELNETLSTLKQTQTQLVESEKMAALGGLVAGVAHEINTPVGIGVTAASSMRESAVRLAGLHKLGKMKRTDLEDFLDISEQMSQMILKSLERAAGLIRSFKQVAVDQSSEGKRRFNVRTYLEEILISLGPTLKPTSIKCKIDCRTDIEIDSYPGAIAQIVTNLLMNALTHAYEPGQEGLLTISVTVDSGQLNLEFSDDGKGIPPGLIGKIFDPFFTTKRDSGGSGLGLNIVYNLVTQTLKGTIACRSEFGKGVTFIANWPLAAAAGHPGTNATEENQVGEKR